MHGMVMGTDGQKMSKTLGNTVDPMEQLEAYGADAVRYYMIAGIPTFGDSAYKPDDLVNMVNSHLADGFGNLLSRVITLANKKEIKLSDDLNICSEEIKNNLNAYTQTISDYYTNFDLYNAANTIHELTMSANKYINDIKPRDKETDPELAIQCLKDLGVVLYVLTMFYGAIIPKSSARAREMLDIMEKGVLFTKLSS
jgi:methionyl-tRNA synthetase